MTQLLQEAFERVAKLPEEEQNKFARFLLAVLESDSDGPSCLLDPNRRIYWSDWPMRPW